MAELAETRLEIEGKRLPIGMANRRDLGWYGMLTLIATEAALFGYLLFSFYYVWSQRPEFQPAEPPSLRLSGPNTIILICSSLTAWWAEKQTRSGRNDRAALGVALTLTLALAFLVIQGFEWAGKDFTPETGAYGSLFFVVTGFHMAHVAVGFLMFAALLVWLRLGYISPARATNVFAITIYWHFVDVVWVLVFTTFYVTPYLA